MIYAIYHIIEAGIIAGTSMIIFGTVMNLIGLTKFNVTEYLGSLITGKTSGALSIISGIALRFIWSIVFAFIYVFALHYFALPISWKTALIFTIVTMLTSELLLRVTNIINPGVKSGKVKAIQLLAINYGASGFIMYIFGHFIYTVVFFATLHAAFTYHIS